MKLSNRYLLILAVVLSGVLYIFSCTRKDQIIDTTVKITRGEDVLLPQLTTGDTSRFKLDKVHSNALWQTNYVGASGLLTGRFNQFGMADITTPLMTNYNTTGQPVPDTAWAFYENEPDKSYINGYVQVNTSNTGEPGRDTGCNIGSMGTIKVAPGVQNLTVQNLAKIHSTKIQFDPASNDYIVTMDLTWQGKLTAPLTKSITGRLKYIKKTRVQFGTSAAYNVFGFQLTFQLNCRDFGVTSTSISDNIQIECNMNFNNK
jgi:polyisoprenoid-binding protein YceI